MPSRRAEFHNTQTHKPVIPPLSKSHSKFKTHLSFLSLSHNSMARRMGLKSLLMSKEMWVCRHPKTESFRVATDIYRSINSVYIDSDGNDTNSELGNWFESDSSAASTSEISSLEDPGEVPEFPVEGLVRGLCSDRFFFEPECTKSIADEGKEKGSAVQKFAKTGGGLEREKVGELLLFNENKKSGKGLEREEDDGNFLFKENKKMGGVLGSETNHSLEQNKKKETNGRVLTLRDYLKVESGLEKEENQPAFKEDGTVGSGSERKKEDGVLIVEENGKFGSVPQREKDDAFFGVEESVGVLPFKESLMMVLDSEDPYMDFRVSMEEMVEAYDLRDWECLEEMLVWYLRVNGKGTHGYIVGAFVDLLLSLVRETDEDGL